MVLFCNNHVAISLALFAFFLVESKSCRKLLSLLEAHKTTHYTKNSKRIGIVIVYFCGQETVMNSLT